MASSSDVEIVDNDSLIDPSEYLADVSTQLVSGVLGLMGFTTALLVGLLAGNPAIAILGRALLAMLLCALVGRLLGSVGEVCVREYVTKYKSDRPQPNKPKELVELDLKQEAHESVMNSMKKAA